MLTHANIIFLMCTSMTMLIVGTRKQEQYFRRKLMLDKLPTKV